MEKYIVNKSLTETLAISQPENGYRFTIDPIILGTHVAPPPGSRVLDMGCGCGIMPVLIAHLHPDIQIIGIELQEQLAAHARQNVLKNKFEHRIEIIQGDIGDITPAQTDGLVDIIISNPPYMKRGQGRLNPNKGKALARHEISLDIRMACQRAKELLTDSGEVYFIFPFHRQMDLINALEANDFHPTSILRIHGVQKKPPIRILIRATKKIQRKCILKPPIYLQNESAPFKKTIHLVFNP